jgi:hypothetical protein
MKKEIYCRVWNSDIEYQDLTFRQWNNVDLTILYRTNGASVEFCDGSKYWLFNGEIHRSDGPAIERPNGYRSWYIRDRNCTNQVEEWLEENKIDYPFNDRTKLLFKLVWG